ncbi:hypothetical protein BDW59DRAFT_147443 [Aspergillus cavernicola]|uniref:F-box domain-containing protein n=1 Tax=Aspergillus cavernicola TaxID=176166 RepID=A0ABR4IA36_9EURO
MIHAFPRGFNYLIPRGWPIHPAGTSPPEANPWEVKAVKHRFRGFGIVTRALAQYTEQHISEFIININFLETGLNCRVFREANTEYNNFATFLRQPNFTCLDLALLVGGQEDREWRCYKSGLHAALREAKNLQQISLHTNVKSDPAADNTARGTSGGSHVQFMSLRIIFPVDAWSNLRRFRLSGFLINKDDLVSFLSACPDTLRSLHLRASCISFTMVATGLLFSLICARN